MSKLLTAQEVADLLRVHKKTIHRMIHSGKLDASKVANKFLIKEEDAKGLLENKNKNGQLIGGIFNGKQY
ncbi:helix-turn-helix domain-containing protein [Bacillus cereus group sp. BfR-BA-01345]|uniref:helix-turn-helix domain-containing protein n=1 Tax=Bacillus cereus group sp. BfR-BA-01345 TaxID=2920308 RepID=UPI001F58780C